MNVEELISGGAPSATFPTIGTTVKGRIEACDEIQQRDFDTGKPKVYEDTGKPMMQLAFTLATDLRDPALDEDNGRRRVFAKGQMRKAIQDAVRQSGQKSGSVIGGTLTVQYHEDKPSERRGAAPQKIYRVKYEPPVAGGTAVENW